MIQLKSKEDSLTILKNKRNFLPLIFFYKKAKNFAILSMPWRLQMQIW